MWELEGGGPTTLRCARLPGWKLDGSALGAGPLGKNAPILSNKASVELLSDAARRSWDDRKDEILAATSGEAPSQERRTVGEWSLVFLRRGRKLKVTLGEDEGEDEDK